AGSDLELFERLRSERLSLAREMDVPPYVVFPDTTLIALAKRRPRDFEELLDVPGIGESKRERYGEAFLAVIEAFEG
ncbi:HRDC domain-containing protein, partial [Sinorhizobium meliloti]